MYNITRQPSGGQFHLGTQDPCYARRRRVQSNVLRFKNLILEYGTIYSSHLEVQKYITNVSTTYYRTSVVSRS